MAHEAEPRDGAGGGNAAKRLCLREELRALATPVRRDALERLKVVAEAAIKGDLGPALGFRANARIEVLWMLGGASEGEPSEIETWWPATVVGRTSRTHALPLEDDDDDDEGEVEEEEGAAPEQIHCPIYEIRYDAKPEADFPEASLAEIVIVDEHELISVSGGSGGADGEDGALSWRVEGSTWEPERGVDEDDAAREGDERGSRPSHPEPSPGTGHPVLEAVKALFREMAEAADDALDPDDDDVFANVRLGEDPDFYTSMSEGQALQFATSMIEVELKELADKYQERISELPAATRRRLQGWVRAYKERLARDVAAVLRTKGTLTPDDLRRIVDEAREFMPVLASGDSGRDES